MLNQNLSAEELQRDLGEFLEACNFMLTQLDPERRSNIFQDKKQLAILHHALNIDKYGQKSFRRKLLVGANDDQIIDFAGSLGIAYKTFEETQTETFRNKLADFRWGNNAETRNFIKIFQYPEYLIPSDRDEIISEEIIDPVPNPFEQLKDYQADVVFQALERVNTPNSKFLIHMPTGAGKTRVAMEIISHFLNSKDEKQVVWLADKMELCDQAVGIFYRVWSHLGKKPIKIFRIWGNANIPDSINGTAFIVTMYQKIREPLKKNQLRVKADLIVPDEAHNAVADTYSEIIEKLKDRRRKQTRIMGLTATPGRGIKSTESKRLSRFFDSQTVEIKTEQGVIEFLQQKRILSRCKRRQLNINIEYTLTKEQWTKLSKSFEQDFPDGLLEEIANDHKRTLKIILELREIAKNSKHILVFCGSKNQSKLMAGFMISAGYAAAHIDGTSPINYRKSVVDKFREGEIQFVFNYGVFTAGFDAPKIDAVVIARPTRSVVLYGQMIGRGMRGPEIGGTKEFQLIDVVDNIITEYGGLDNVYEYFSEYWEE